MTMTTTTTLSPFAARSVTDVIVRRISPNDTNYFALLFEPAADRVDAVCVVEVFEPGGKTPPNTHFHAHEFFYVLKGTGLAHCNGQSRAIGQGDALMLRPGAEHVLENTGEAKLYTLTFMTPNEGFAELILAGTPVELDDEDRAVLLGARR